jgi:heme/copper-type cytochrome/quinol oxidase subunit 2
MRFGVARRGVAVAGGVVVLLGLVALLPLVADTRTSRMEVVLVARDMAFFAAGDATRNPTIVVPAGAQVRVVLRNDDPGVIHDFAVKSLDVAIKPLRAAGEGVTTFRAPDRPGRHEYICNPHAVMMRGTLIVE